MEGRKVKNNIIKNILHWSFIVAMVALSIVAYVFRTQIENHFLKDLTKIELLNDCLHYVPKLIMSIQLIVLPYIICFIITILSKIALIFTDKVKTIINLVESLIKWIVVIASIMRILTIWGVNTETLLASAGIITLIVGLSAQSLIADVLAGIFIVIEGKYVIGDIVVIDGWRGKIINIGIRTTELQDISGNIKIINNSEIKSVINQTKLMSVAFVSINVATDKEFETIEKTIISGLPEIKSLIPAIQGEINYKGVSKIEEDTIELLFSVTCYEEDLYQVQRDLQRQIKLFLDRNNILSFATPTYVIDEVKNQK